MSNVECRILNIYPCKPSRSWSWLNWKRNGASWSFSSFSWLWSVILISQLVSVLWLESSSVWGTARTENSSDIAGWLNDWHETPDQRLLHTVGHENEILRFAMMSYFSLFSLFIGVKREIGSNIQLLMLTLGTSRLVGSQLAHCEVPYYILSREHLDHGLQFATNLFATIILQRWQFKAKVGWIASCLYQSGLDSNTSGLWVMGYGLWIVDCGLKILLLDNLTQVSAVPTHSERFSIAITTTIS